MRTLVHLSDLHFGRTDPHVIAPLIDSVREASPDLVVVSGDLTQRAKTHQFREAREFLERLPAPRLVVPGNHDVPLWNVAYRFARPLHRYRRHITQDLEPFYADEEIAVLGLNTARSLTFKGGRLSREQIERARGRLCARGPHVTKIVVTHHPFDMPESEEEDQIVGRARAAMEAFAQCGADVLLAGHMHTSHTGSTAHRYPIDGHAAVVIQAGTASSTRGRGEANSYNVVRVEPSRIEVERRECAGGGGPFRTAAVERFERSGDTWRRVGRR